MRPNYVREWIKEKKDKWRKMIEDKIEVAKKQSLIPADAVIDPKKIIKENRLAEIGLNASMDSTGRLSFGSLEDEVQDLGGRSPKEEDNYGGLDVGALEDSDDENVSNAFKGALLRPEDMKARYQKKSGFDETGTYDPRVKEFDMNYLKNFKKTKVARMDYISKNWPKSTLFN